MTPYLKQKGYVLVVILVFSFMTGTVVFSSLSDSIIQERISGNFEKQLNAQLIAEQGIFETIDSTMLVVENKSDITVTEIIDSASEEGKIVGSSTLLKGSYNVSLVEDKNGYFVITSAGQRFEGKGKMEAVFELVPNIISVAGRSPFSKGVTGCDGILVKGKGMMDSYNSEFGAYGGVNKNNNITLRTLTGDGEIKLEGEVDVDGDVIATSKLVLYEGGSITGNVHSNGDLEFKKSLTIGGTGSAYEGYKQENGVVGGNILANKSISIKSSTVGGSVISASSISSSGSVIGGIESENASEDPVEFIELDDGSLDVNDPDDVTCNDLDIENAVLSVNSDAGSAKDLLIDGDDDVYELAEADADFLVNKDSSGSPSKYMTPKATTFAGQSEMVLMYDNVTIKGELIVATGHDVVVYVKGNLKSEGKGKITIPEDSSLTLIIKGSIEINEGTEVFTPDNGITTSGKPVFSIYSSYSGTGIKIAGGDEEIYAAIYAPLTDIEFSSDNSAKGAVMGRSVSFTKDGGYHYDEALADVSGTSATTTTVGNKLVFKEWRYSDPE